MNVKQIKELPLNTPIKPNFKDDATCKLNEIDST
jgi:hypothetical protein